MHFSIMIICNWRSSTLLPHVSPQVHVISCPCCILFCPYQLQLANRSALAIMLTSESLMHIASRLHKLIDHHVHWAQDSAVWSCTCASKRQVCYKVDSKV